MSRTSEKIIGSLLRFVREKPRFDSLGHGKMLDLVVANYSKAQDKTFRKFLILLLVWFISYLISVGGVSEVSFSGVKLVDLQFFLYWSPVIIAFLFYQFCSGLVMMDFMHKVIMTTLRNGWPNSYSEEFGHLFTPFSVINLEFMEINEEYSTWSFLMDAPWKMMTILGGFIVPLIGLGHSIQLLFENRPRLAYLIFILVLTLAITLRAFFVLKYMFYEIKRA